MTADRDTLAEQVRRGLRASRDRRGERDADIIRDLAVAGLQAFDALLADRAALAQERDAEHELARKLLFESDAKDPEWLHAMHTALITAHENAVRERDAAEARVAALEAERDAAREQAAANADKVRLERERREAAEMAARAEGERADVMQHERDWEQEVVNADLWNRVERAEADLQQLRAAVNDADTALACAQLPCSCDEGDECYCLSYPIAEQVKAARAALAAASAAKEETP